MVGTRGTMKRRMPGGDTDVDDSGLATDQGTEGGNECNPVEGDNQERLTEVRESGHGTEKAKNVRATTTRLRTRAQSSKGDEIIPAHATSISTPAEARKYTSERLGTKEQIGIATDAGTVAKLLESAITKNYASGNRELIDTVQAAIYILRESGRTEWSGAKKVEGKNTDSGTTAANAQKLKHRDAGVQKDKEDEDSDAIQLIQEAEEMSNQNNLSFADEIKIEIRNTISGAMEEAQKRVEHFTKELDKRIEYMYEEQTHIKEAHELGLAQARAGYKLTERKTNLAAAQMEATLGIIAETEKRMEKMKGHMDSLERKREREREESRGTVQGQKNKGKGTEEMGKNNQGKQGPRNTKEGSLVLQGQKNKGEDKKLVGGSEVDGEESEEEANKARPIEGQREDKDVEVRVRSTPEWGGWEDIRELSPYEPEQTPSTTRTETSKETESPSPPPPNQLQYTSLEKRKAPTSTYETGTQETQIQRSHAIPTRNESRSWAEVASQEATRKAVFERIREKDCQVFVDFKLQKGQADFWKHKAGKELTLKANEIISNANMKETRGKPEEVLIWGAHRIGDGKYIFDVNSPVAANWLRAEGNREAFAKGLSEGAIVVLRSYPVIIKYVPITFDVDNANDLKEIVAKTRGNNDQIISARWLKDPSKRGPNQKFAFLTAELKSPEAANEAILTGAYIHGKKCEITKYKSDAIRCNKCQRYGHVAITCRKEHPTCGTCAKEHWTSQCESSAAQVYCANCETNGHAARDFRCPILEEKNKIQDHRNPDRKLRFYPTIEAWTHELLSEYAPNHTGSGENGLAGHSGTFH